jgi:O-antigen/teichoic acid export membrane protein
MSVRDVARGGMWLYIGGLLSNFLSYVYWLIAANIISPSVIGSAAAIISLAGLLVSIFSFGLASGLPRFIGLSRGRSNYQQLSTYFFTALTFTLLTTLLASLMVVLFYLTRFNVFNLSSFDLAFVIIFTCLTSWPSVYGSLFTSFLKTEVTLVSNVIAAVLRLLVGIPLLYLGFDFLGVLLGYMISMVASNVYLVYCGKQLLRNFGVKVKVAPSYLGHLLRAGLAPWIPSILGTLVQSLGILSIYSIVGGTETGLYYVAFAIFGIVQSLPSSVMSLMFPVLSGMDDGRKRAASRAIRLSLAITAPVALVLVLYPGIPLSLLGSKYIQASNILRILTLAVVISPISSGYINYVYAKGKYSHVTMLGLVETVGKLILYALLVSSWGATGIAVAYTLGSFITLIAILPSGQRIGFKLDWSKCAMIIAIPAVLTTIFFTLNIHWLIGISALLLISLTAYTRFGILTKNDLAEISHAFLSKSLISRLHSYTRPIIRLIYGK